MPHPLDDPILDSLTGHHARFAVTDGGVYRYQPDVSPLMTHPATLTDAVFDSMITVAGRGSAVSVSGRDLSLPQGWTVTGGFELVQLTGDDLDTCTDPDAAPLGTADIPEILDLVGRTKPGPFLQRTIELGTYLGIRRGGTLIAMAGERLHPQGWTEISAVCTDPAARGEGLATRLVRAVGAGIRERGEVPFMHAVGTNTSAIRLYESIGFVVRQRTPLTMVRIPEL